MVLLYELYSCNSSTVMRRFTADRVTAVRIYSQGLEEKKMTKTRPLLAALVIVCGAVACHTMLGHTYVSYNAVLYLTWGVCVHVLSCVKEMLL